MLGPVETKSDKDEIAEPIKARVQEQVSHVALSGPHADVLTLQRIIGNQAVSQLLQSGREPSPTNIDEQVETARNSMSKPLPSAAASPADAKGLPSSVRSILKSGGQPLDPTLHAFMKSRFGYDFSQVRVHAYEQATASARELGARAYTVGSDIVFGEGRYAPSTNEGRRLLAHELAHVIQQSRGGAPPTLDAEAAHESSAEKSAADVIAGHSPVQVGGATGVGVARDKDDKDPEIEKALEPLKESTSPEKQVTPGKQKALTPDELIDDHVFGPRVHEEVGDLTKRLTKLEAELEQKPSDAELKRKVESMRKELRVLEGKPLDPEGKGTKVPGHGRINTRAAIQIVDKDGNLIALERGRWKPEMHAEEDAIAKLRKRLGDTKLPLGSRIDVAGNQVVCSDCRRALKQFAIEYKADAVVGHIRVRPKIRGKGTASGKTTERMGLTKEAPKARVKPEILYKRPPPVRATLKGVTSLKPPTPEVSTSNRPSNFGTPEYSATPATAPPATKRRQQEGGQPSRLERPPRPHRFRPRQLRYRRPSRPRLRSIHQAHQLTKAPPTPPSTAPTAPASQPPAKTSTPPAQTPAPPGASHTPAVDPGKATVKAGSTPDVNVPKLNFRVPNINLHGIGRMATRSLLMFVAGWFLGRYAEEAVENLVNEGVKKLEPEIEKLMKKEIERVLALGWERMNPRPPYYMYITIDVWRMGTYEGELFDYVYTIPAVTIRSVFASTSHWIEGEWGPRAPWPREWEGNFERVGLGVLVEHNFFTSKILLESLIAN